MANLNKVNKMLTSFSDLVTRPLTLTVKPGYELWLTAPVSLPIWGHQTHSKPFQFAVNFVNLSGAMLTPSSENGRTDLFEMCAFGERSFPIAVAVDGRMSSGEFLQISHAAQALRAAFASLK